MCEIGTTDCYGIVWKSVSRAVSGARTGASQPRGALIMSGFRRSRFHSFVLRLDPGNDNRYVTHVVSSHEKWEPRSRELTAERLPQSRTLPHSRALTPSHPPATSLHAPSYRSANPQGERTLPIRAAQPACRVRLFTSYQRVRHAL